MGVSDATFYNRRKKFSGLSPSEVRPLKQLEEENAKRVMSRCSVENLTLLRVSSS